jgi:hypothetical protein
MSVIFARIELVLVIGGAALWFAPSFDLGRTSTGNLRSMRSSTR